MYRTATAYAGYPGSSLSCSEMGTRWTRLQMSELVGRTDMTWRTRLRARSDRSRC